MAEESLGHGVVGSSPHTPELRYSTFTHVLKWLLALNIGVTLGVIFYNLDGTKGPKSFAALIIAIVLIPILYGLLRRSIRIDERRYNERWQK